MKNMESNFKPVYSFFTKEFLDTYIDLERNLMLHQPLYLLKENKWQINPNTNKSEDLNNFYSFYPDGIEGTKKECLEKIKNYEKHGN